ncbi:spermatogenesis and centriole associated 1 [Rhinolophus ferrumequinum]|uniref:Spermatogenesis and centriole associated 1 n=1 Tax=Rhinolophus ferrumequinum TaxID=59479 RepID=A0A7J7R100_RHIFE|nr:spermatogenesis and centriole associated 1 [Rhinolophus ferrumequinum]
MSLLTNYEGLRHQIEKLVRENEELKKLVRLICENHELKSAIKTQAGSLGIGGFTGRLGEVAAGPSQCHGVFLPPSLTATNEPVLEEVGIVALAPLADMLNSPQPIPPAGSIMSPLTGPLNALLPCPGSMSQNSQLTSHLTSPMSVPTAGTLASSLDLPSTGPLVPNSHLTSPMSVPTAGTLASSLDLPSTGPLVPNSHLTSPMSVPTAGTLASSLDLPSTGPLVPNSHLPSPMSVPTAGTLASSLDLPSTGPLVPNSHLTSPMSVPTAGTLASSLGLPSTGPLVPNSHLTSPMSVPTAGTLASSLGLPSTGPLVPNSHLTSPMSVPTAGTLVSSLGLPSTGPLVPNSHLTSPMSVPTASTLASSLGLPSTGPLTANSPLAGPLAISLGSPLLTSMAAPLGVSQNLANPMRNLVPSEAPRAQLAQPLRGCPSGPHPSADGRPAGTSKVPLSTEHPQPTLDQEPLSVTFVGAPIQTSTPVGTVGMAGPTTAFSYGTSDTQTQPGAPQGQAVIASVPTSSTATRTVTVLPSAPTPTPQAATNYTSSTTHIAQRNPHSPTRAHHSPTRPSPTSHSPPRNPHSPPRTSSSPASVNDPRGPRGTETSRKSILDLERKLAHRKTSKFPDSHREPKPLAWERLVGEIAFQLDRRILSSIFPERVRLYGFTVSNIPEKIIQASLNPSNHKLDEELCQELTQRYVSIMNRLQSLGYNGRLHPALTEQLVNAYGILRERPELAASEGGSYSLEFLQRVLVETMHPSMLTDGLLLLSCLSQLAHDDGKPMFIW